MPRTWRFRTRYAAPLEDVASAVTMTVAALFWLFPWYLLQRYVGGSVSGPRHAAAVLAGASLAAGLSGLSRWVFDQRLPRTRIHDYSLFRIGLAIVPTLALIAFGWVWTSRVSGPSAVLAWLLILAEEAAAWSFLFDWPQRWSGRGQSARDLPGLSAGETLLQYLTRLRDSEGLESVNATLRVDFAVGQQSADAHLTFCPPFAEVPAVTCEQTEGASVSIRIAERQRYGTRLETRLPRPAPHAQSVVVQVHAAAGRSVLASVEHPS